MTYIVFHASPEYHQMSIDDLLFGNDNVRSYEINANDTSTRTYDIKNSSAAAYARTGEILQLIQKIAMFNAKYEYLRNKDRRELYYEFYIPKKSGGLRKIDAPLPELKDALRELKRIFEEDFTGQKVVGGQTRSRIALYHTSAFAYIRKRSTIDCVKRHQSNKSNWFAKFDLSNFFGSTTLEYTLKMFSMVFPFSEVMKWEMGNRELTKALDLAFLDGGLPQGTPISPLITNIIMIPVDYTLSNYFREFKSTNKKGDTNEYKCVYTRYADDFIVSSRYDFNCNDVEQFIVDTLKSFGAPFTIKHEKTRYGSRAGHNVNLGVWLNANNDITIGHKNKKRLKAMLSSYAMDRKNGTAWDINDIRVMDGYRNYYRMVEPDDCDNTMSFLSGKFGFDIAKAIRADLRGGF